MMISQTRINRNQYLINRQNFNYKNKVSEFSIRNHKKVKIRIPSKFNKYASLVYKLKKSKSQNQKESKISNFFHFIIMIPLRIFSVFILFSSLILFAYSIPTLPEGIHSVIAGQFQQNSSNRSQQVMTYYDINQDQYCQPITIVTTYTQQKTVISRFLVLYLWNQEQQLFIKNAEMNLSFLNVEAVFCTQFYDRDTPENDLVITYDYAPANPTEQLLEKKYAIDFVKIKCTLLKDQCEFLPSFEMIAETKMFDPVLPSVAVLEGKMSLIFRKNNQAFVINFEKDLTTGTVNYQMFSLLKSTKFISISKTYTQISSTLAYQNSYFGDYNGDGIADLIISQKFAQIQNNFTRIHFFKYDKKISMFTPETTLNLKGVEQQLTTYLQFFNLQDLNSDGRIDLILLFRSGVVQIHYNKIPSSKLTLIEPNGYETFPFDLHQTNENYIAKIHRMLPQPGYTPIATSPILFGDFNLDGYEQMIIDFQYEVQTGQWNSNGQPVTRTAYKSVLFMNQPCLSATDCGDSAFNPKFLKTLDMFKIRKFIINNNLPVSYKANQSFKLSFIDLYKDGKLDLFSVILSSQTAYYGWNLTPTRQSQIQIYFNNIHYDAFFMKVRVMRGTNYAQGMENLPIAGGNVNCFVTGLSGEMLPRVGNQFPQIGRMIQLPYVFFGLGRTNNYVNDLTITIPYVSSLLSYQFLWTPIIPNSQIITLANPQGQWQLSAFIQPTKRMVSVTLLVILSLVILGIVICKLTAQQKSEDKQNLESFYSILR